MLSTLIESPSSMRKLEKSNSPTLYTACSLPVLRFSLTIQGEQPGFINKVPYNFLEVNMQGIQVWHLREVVNTTYNLWDYGYGAFWPEPGWGAPYYTNAVSQVTPELVK